MTSPTQPGSLYVLDFESLACRAVQPPPAWRTDIAPGIVHQNGEPPYRISCPPDPVRAGQRSARFQLNQTDPEVPGSGSKRAELKDGPEPDNQERWYGFSIYLDNWQPDSAPESLAQWHQADPPDARFQGSPPLSLGIKGAEWQISMRKPSWDDTADRDTVNTAIGSWAKAAPGWTDWVFHVVWRSGAGGQITVWKDGNDTPVFEFAGQNKFADGSGNYMKFGIYKWPWVGGPTDVDERIAFFDELRIADQSGSRAAVSPPVSGSRPGCLSMISRLFRRQW